MLFFMLVFFLLVTMRSCCFCNRMFCHFDRTLLFVVTDGRTDSRTQDHSICHTGTASRGKNQTNKQELFGWTLYAYPDLLRECDAYRNVAKAVGVALSEDCF